MTTVIATTVGDCVKCGRPMVTQRTWRRRRHELRPAGYTRHNGHGLCNSCYVAAHKRENRKRGIRPLPAPTRVARRVADGDWRSKATCIDFDPEVWFPVGETGASTARTAAEDRAVTICRRCPVVTQCLAWALATDQKHGIWGGATEVERRQMRAAS